MGAFAFDASDAWVRDFLDASTVVELATVSPYGRPFVTPLWFVTDDGDHRSSPMTSPKQSTSRCGSLVKRH